MPDAGIQPPYLDPSQYPAYLDLQRKQMLAQALMQGSQQMNQTPQDWNSMRVVPKRSGLQSISALATGLMAGKAQKDLMGAQNNYFQGLMGGPSSPPTAAPAPSAPPSAPGLSGPASPGIAAGPAPQAAATPPAQTNPMLLTGEPRTSQALLNLMGQQEYGKALAGRYAPTDLEKSLRAAGIDPASPEGRQALIQGVNKANYIAPIEEREGSVERDPVTNAVIGINPKTTTGGVNLYDAQGRYSGQSLAPGAAQAIEASEKASALGQTAGKYSILPTAGGGSTVVGGPGTTPAGAGRQAPRVGQPTGGPPSAPTPPGWEGMPKLPVSSALGAPDAFTHGRLQAAGAKDAELSSQYGKEADLADQKLTYNADARKILGKAEVGPSSEWLTENRARLLEWGVPESLVPGSGTVTPTMELNKVLKQSALQGARQIFGSRMTQMEVKLQHEELSPSPSMTHEAIQSLMHQDDVKQLYAKQRADDYGKYIQAKGDPLRFESWYSKNFPLTKFAQAHSEAPAPAIPAQPHQFTPEEIQAEMKRRGL